MLDFLYTAISFVLLLWHRLFSAIGLSQDSGLNWALSIVFLTITARLILFRFFVKQVHYQRKMQEMQPRMNAIRTKFKDDKQAQQREMMKLQQEEGFNPITGCLPIFLQIPIFIALFHVLRHLAHSASASLAFINNNHSTVGLSKNYLHQLGLYGFSASETASGSRAKLFGAPLAASFHDSSSVINGLGGSVGATRTVILPLLIISALATMATQLLVKRNQTVTPEGTAATMQKLMLYVFPLGVLASGLLFNFPLGVLLYWFASNLWTLGQQAYIIRFHPPEVPGAQKATASTASSALAPRPGAKPNYAKTRPNVTLDKSTNNLDDLSTSDSVDNTDTSAAAPNGTAPNAPNAPKTPRPGQRPSRPAGRPNNRRPNQAKKRR